MSDTYTNLLVIDSDSVERPEQTTQDRRLLLPGREAWSELSADGSVSEYIFEKRGESDARTSSVIRRIARSGWS
jgi:hypothetical protein